MKKEITINSVDCSTLFAEYGYVVNYKKIHGSAGGTMLVGSTTEDIIAIKAVIELKFKPQSEEALSRLLSMIYSADYVTVRYFDPKDGIYRTIEAIYDEMTVTHAFTNIYDDEIWQIDALTLTER